MFAKDGIRLERRLSTWHEGPESSPDGSDHPDPDGKAQSTLGHSLASTFLRLVSEEAQSIDSARFKSQQAH